MFRPILATSLILLGASAGSATFWSAWLTASPR